MNTKAAVGLTSRSSLVSKVTVKKGCDFGEMKLLLDDGQLSN